VVWSAWSAFGHSCITADEYPNYTWPRLFREAGLAGESAGIAREYLKVLRSNEMSPSIQNTAFRLRTWFDDEKTVLADWLGCIREGMPAEGWQDGGPADEYYRAGDYDTAKRVAEATLGVLKKMPGADFEKVNDEWCHWIRYPVGGYLTAGGAAKLEQATLDAIANGHESYGVWMADVAVLKGESVSPELIEKMKEDKETGYFLEYYIAREAGASGDLDRAFTALERALAIWTNPPLSRTDEWERDALWGDLREHAEFKRLFAEKRRRIGPAMGTLWHFPGWVGRAV